MPDDFTPKVLRVQQYNTIDQTGGVVVNYQVQYSVGQHGPFTLTVPGATFSAAAVQAAMQAQADELRKLTGQ